MSRYKRPDYDDIHGFVERVEDVLLSESSWSTSDSDCSGCMHLSKESLQSEEHLVANTVPDEVEPLGDEDSPLRVPLVTPAGGSRPPTIRQRGKPQRNHRHVRHQSANRTRGLGNSFLTLGRNTSNFFNNTLPANKAKPAYPVQDPPVTDKITVSGVRCSSSDTTVPFHHRGRMLQQRALLAAGAQPWNSNVCASHGRRFAYAATLVIYVYEVEDGSSDWQLCSILAEHRKVITSINWHPSNPDLIASSSEDQKVCVWSITRQQVLVAVSLCRAPTLVSWCTVPGQRDVVSFSTASGPIQLWDCSEGSEPTTYRETNPYARGLRLYKWHPTIPGRLVVAHSDARITIYREDSGNVKSNWCPESESSGELASGEVTGLEWADCSPDYLLVSYTSSKLWLLDVTGFTVITEFVLPATVTIATMGWLPEAPGMFVTGDTNKGVLRVWTVGKTTPLSSMIVKDTGFHELCATRCPSSMQHNEIGYSGGSNNVAIPSVPVMCLFRDGGVGLYHLRRKLWVFKRDHGHTETIFDCSFKPDDSDILATGSFDGSIKIWKVDTLESVETLPNCRSIIYSVSWAPADLNCIVAATNDGRVFIWDLGKHKILQEFSGHKKGKVYCVTWNQKDSRRIASVGESCFCLVYEVSGQLLQAYQHPEAVYGCDWRNADTLATGCHDGRIRIYNVTSPHKEPSVILKAHNKKVFKVQWNPVYSDILCSGSDDTTVRLWAVSRGQCLAVLVGHSDNVRGLAWCPEVPYLLVSGSWDRSIRVWDTRTAECLDIVMDHGADIYGLSIHPVRPFLVASCSRDSTVRLWSLSSFVSSMYLRVLANSPLQSILSTSTSNSVSSLANIPNELRGMRAKHLSEALKNTSVLSLCPSSCTEVAQLAKLLRLTSDLFSADVHIRNLWDLVSVIGGQCDVSSLSPQYPGSIVHHSHLAKCDMAAAEKDYQKSLGVRIMSLRRNATQDFALSDVAQRYLRCGALRQYCDVMVKRGMYDHALAVAPAVSMDYWKSLIGKYSQQLMSEDNDQCVPYLVAAKDLDKLVEFHIGRGNIKAAFSACVTLKDNQSIPTRTKKTIPELPPRPNTLTDGNAIAPLSPTEAERQGECALLLAEWHLKRGSPVLSCCAMLAADQCKAALLYLLRGHELEMVVTVGRLLSLNARTFSLTNSALTPYVNSAIRYLCYRAIRLNLNEVALDLAKTHSKGIDAQILICEVLLQINLPLSQDEAYKLLTEVGSSNSTFNNRSSEAGAASPLSDEDVTPLQEEQNDSNEVNSTRESKETVQNRKTDSISSRSSTSEANNNFVVNIMKMLLSSTPVHGINAAITYVIEQIRAGHLDEPTMWRIVQLIQALPISSNGGPKGNAPGGQSAVASPIDSNNANGIGHAPVGHPGDKGVLDLSREVYGCLLTISSSTGAVKAAELGYKPVVQHLVSITRLYLDQLKPQHADVLMPFTKSLQNRLDESNTSSRSKSRSSQSPGVTQHSAIGLGSKVGVNVGGVMREMWVDRGLTRVTGSHLPRHSDSHTCRITRNVIKGPSFALENGESVLGVNEALMWAKVHPFSPLGSRVKLNPF